MTLDPCFLSMLVKNGAEPIELPTLFHGTTLACAQRILVEGLLPRSITGVATMQEAMGEDLWQSSDSDCVYVSDVQSAMYAVNHAIVHGGKPAVVEIAPSFSAKARLQPDEDVLAAGIVDGHDRVLPRDERQGAAKRLMRERRDLWPASLKLAGVVALEGSVEATALSGHSVDLAEDEMAMLNKVGQIAKLMDAQAWHGFGLGPTQRVLYERMTAWSTGVAVAAWDAVPFYGSIPHAGKRVLRRAFGKRWRAMEPALARCGA